MMGFGNPLGRQGVKEVIKSNKVDIVLIQEYCPDLTPIRSIWSRSDKESLKSCGAGWGIFFVWDNNTFLDVWIGKFLINTKFGPWKIIFCWILSSMVLWIIGLNWIYGRNLVRNP